MWDNPGVGGNPRDQSLINFKGFKDVFFFHLHWLGSGGDQAVSLLPEVKNWHHGKPSSPFFIKKV